MVGIPSPKTRVWRISKHARTYERKEIWYGQESPTQTLCKSIVFHKWNARVLIWDKRKLIWAKISSPNTLLIDSFPQVRYTYVDLGRAKNSIFKMLGKRWLGFPHLKRECGATLSARELTGEKKLIGARISHPSIVQIDRLPQVKYTCVDFGGRLKVASLKC